VFYVIENGNLQKKVQPYAADRVQRFVEMMPPPKIQVGPGSYDLVKPLPLPPTMPGPIGGVSLINRTGEIEPPIKQVKKKLLQTAHQFTKTVQSVPSIPTGNKMLLLSSEEEEQQNNAAGETPQNQEAGNATTTAESQQHSP